MLCAVKKLEQSDCLYSIAITDIDLKVLLTKLISHIRFFSYKWLEMWLNRQSFGLNTRGKTQYPPGSNWLGLANTAFRYTILVHLSKTQGEFLWPLYRTCVRAFVHCEYSCYHSRGPKFDKKFIELDKNVCHGNITIKFEYGYGRVEK